MPYFPDNWNDALIWGLVLSVLMFVISIIVAWILIVRMPVDYLLPEADSGRPNRSRHPVTQGVFWIIRNLIGVALVLSGLVMLITPGQGILFIFLGLTMIDFPGKHQLVCRLLNRPGFIHTINRIRARAGQPPLEVPG